ncbi:MAG: hypothetical protein UY21_C0020G0006 [Microgenomates group bacterium GW2011_GWA1_48_10]|nr:MAG: hypothetical protein UY21_C0020G0006 [Microgenomates group bacterium GW2011_GWA1_48_10]
MAENFAEFYGKKAFEISYALLRVAGSSKNAAFSKHLENEAFNFLWASATGSYPQAILTASLLEYFMRLGREASYIGNTNADIILSELRTFKAAMKDIGNPATLPDSEVDLTGIFSKGGDGTDEIIEIQNKRIDEVIHEDKPDESIEIQGEINPANVAGLGEWNATTAEKIMANRQSAILERIRQSGNCKLKEIQESLPGISERTIRYDLQRLAELGLVERIGSGGPGTSYKVKEKGEAEWV